MDRGAWWAAVHGVSKSQTRLSDFTFTFHFDGLEKEMATHSSVLAWRITGTGDPGGLPSLGSHRVRHNWSDLAAAPACPLYLYDCVLLFLSFSLLNILDSTHEWYHIVLETLFFKSPFAAFSQHMLIFAHDLTVTLLLTYFCLALI